MSGQHGSSCHDPLVSVPQIGRNLALQNIPTGVAIDILLGLHILWPLPAGTAQEQLAQCDDVRAEDRALWAAQDVLVGALPHALSEAFQTVEQDFLQSTKACVLQLSRAYDFCSLCSATRGPTPEF